MNPRSLYHTLALAEAVTWTLLILGMVGKYGFGIDIATTIGGGVHGFVFLCYVVATLVVWIDKRWPARTGLLGLGSAIIPYLTIPFERRVDRRGLLDGPWRLAAGGDRPGNLFEHLVAFALRRPIPALVIVVVVVSVVFALLLNAGPPTEWFS